MSQAVAVLLGAQRFDPTLGNTVAMQGIAGRFAMITAGWQEREDEDEELGAHLGGDVVNLRLHARSVELFQRDPELSNLHRERQALLRHLQEVYRIRLNHAQEAERELLSVNMPERMRDEVNTISVESLKSIDAWHLEKCAQVREEFDEKLRLNSRPEVMRHRDEIQQALEGCVAIAIAGGHVAVLMNRLAMFGLRDFIGNRTVFAWSAGAMAITDRIVLFHDSPPQGTTALQVLDVGLGLVPKTVVFPTPHRRLDMDATERLASMSRRFEPATCLVLQDRSWVTWTGTNYGRASGVLRVTDTGKSVSFAPLRGLT